MFLIVKTIPFLNGAKMYKFGDEIIKPIKDFENYGVSNKGYVYKNLKYGLLEINYKTHRLKPYKSPLGYLFVRLSNKGKTKTAYIHKLVAEHFLNFKEDEMKIIHIDGNKENNSVENLKVIPKIKKEVLKDEILQLKNQGKSIEEISKILNISIPYLYSILKDRKILTIELSKENYKKLEKLAKGKGISISKLINKIIDKI